MPSALTHITIGYPRQGLMDLLAETARWNGCDHVAMPSYWPLNPFGVMNKITVLKSYLDSGAADSGQIIMFTDAFDVTMIEHASIIVEKFLAMEAAVVFGAESSFWPLQGRELVRQQFDVYDSKWRYLNSGGYIGYAWAIRQLIDYCVKRIGNEDYDFYKPDDQALMQRFFLEHRESRECPVALDILPAIFCCLNTSEQDFVVSKGRVTGARTGKTVSVLHANGSKHNFDIMSRYWALNGGSDGSEKRRDLRIATANGQPLAYDGGREKLVATASGADFPAVFLVKGDRQAICLSDTAGLLTFSPEGQLQSGAEIVNVWEVLSISDAVITYHRNGLDAYCDLPTDVPIGLAPLPLPVLLRESFDGLLQCIQKYEQRF